MNIQNRANNKVVDLIFNNIKIIALLFLFLIVFGTATFANIPRGGFPEVTVNIAMVTVPYPNATALQVEDQIAGPLESALDAIDDVESVETVSTDNAGVAVVTIDAQANINDTVAEIADEVKAIRFPDDAMDPIVDKFDVAMVGDFMIGVTGVTDPWVLYEVTQDIENELGSVDGISSIEQMNPLTPELVITFRQDDLDKFSLARHEVEGILKLANFNAPVGSFKNAENQDVNVSIEKRVDTVNEYKVFEIADGVMLQEVANVEILMNNNNKYNRIGFRDEGDPLSDFNIERAIVMSIYSDKGSDLLTLEDDLHAKIEQIESKEKYDGVNVVSMFSMAESTRLQIDEIQGSLLGQPIDSLGSFSFLGYLFGGLFLVVLLLFVFMNARIAIMAALAIPLSLFVTTIYLSMIGIGLNTLVLFAMILAIGLVVDPTIVFLESMQRFKEQGFDGHESAVKTIKTVGVGITLAVLTNILVFVPFGIVSGFFGEIIKFIPVTIIPSMVASLLIPVLFMMPVAAKVLKPRKNIDRSVDPELVGVWKVSRAIGKAVTWTLKKGKWFAFMRIVIVALALALPFAIQGALISTGEVEVVQFSSAADSDAFFIQATLDTATDFEDAVYDVAVPIQDMVAAQPEVRDFSYMQQSGNSYMLLVNLLPYQMREDEGMRTSIELVEDIEEVIKQLELDAEFFVLADGAGPSLEEFAVKVRLLGDDSEVLAVASEDVQQYLLSLEGVTEVQDNVSDVTSGGSIVLELEDDDMFTRNPMMVYGLISNQISENDIGTVTISDTKFDIVSKIEPRVASVDELKDIVVFDAPDELPPGMEEEIVDVNVGDLIVGVKEYAPESIRRANGKRYIEVSAAISEDVTALEIQNLLDEYLSPEKLVSLGLTEDATDFKGEADSITKSFTELGISLLVAIFMIYVLLVAFFRSYLEPFIILFAIPLGLIGVILAVWATTGQLGFLELLGVVAMAGIVVNVTILLLDYANQQLKRGVSPEKAIATSVAVRFRPIVLTQLTAFGSLAPLVFISPFWKGLAAAIICGIASSALLSLFVTPVLYVWVNKIGRGLKMLPKTFNKLKNKMKRKPAPTPTTVSFVK
ncbi:efflux RND transporter permease subunit [Candidatus Uhrbacteria bacterium]|jgi:multidrug efflux pump subunit AcrB|nr:efflux RND transporter permease subunit [Candidatus Uhrbacteria bacterium]